MPKTPSKKPTSKQIEKECAVLRDYQFRVRPFTAFGDSNRDAIGIQIRVLEKLMDEEEIYDTWSDDREIGMANDALAWLRGEAEKPSKEWKSLLT